VKNPNFTTISTSSLWGDSAPLEWAILGVVWLVEQLKSLLRCTQQKGSWHAGKNHSIVKQQDMQCGLLSKFFDHLSYICVTIFWFTSHLPLRTVMNAAAVNLNVRL